MQTFIIDIEDSNGDVIDRRYYAGRAWHAIRQLDVGEWVIPAAARTAIYRHDAGSWSASDGGFSWGYAPCAASDADYRIECACGCGTVMNEGTDHEGEDS